MEDDDDIWMPPSADGKADGIQLLKGSDIPSQYVNANDAYMTARPIATLATVQALTGTNLSVAMRADGIIANLPANGKLEAAELARMESNAIFPTLFPEEQQALPELWKLLLAPSGNAQSVTVPGFDLTFTPELQEPGGLTTPTSLAIATLDTAWQTVARRVQLVHNADNDATTIQVTDIDMVLADPQAFTPAEVDLLKAIKVEFLRRATSTEHAYAKAPTPGPVSSHAQLGAMALDFTGSLVMTESRTNTSSSYSAVLQTTTTLTGTLRAPVATDVIVLVELDTGGETVIRTPAPQLSSFAAGTFIVERYNAMGARVDDVKIAFPGFTPRTNQTTDASEYVDYALQTSTGAPLYRNAVSGSSGYVNFRWETSAAASSPVSPAILTTVAPMMPVLPTGRYMMPWGNGNVLLDLYPEGVATVKTVSGTQRLRGSLYTGSYPYRRTLGNGSFTVFVSGAATGNTASGLGGSAEITPDMRIK